MIARLRRPVRLLECPDRASLLRPGGLPQGSAHPAAGAGTGFMRLSGRLGFSPSGDWDSGNPAFAISRGSPGAPSRTPRQRPPVSWHAIVPGFLSDHGSAIRSKDTSSSPCPLCGLYSSAPRGARRISSSAPSVHFFVSWSVPALAGYVAGSGIGRKGPARGSACWCSRLGSRWPRVSCSDLVWSAAHRQKRAGSTRVGRECPFALGPSGRSKPGGERVR